MTPSTISAGFRKCGVYPFNPDAIDCGISVDNIDEPDKDNRGMYLAKRDKNSFL